MCQEMQKMIPNRGMGGFFSVKGEKNPPKGAFAFGGDLCSFLFLLILLLFYTPM